MKSQLVRLFLLLVVVSVCACESVEDSFGKKSQKLRFSTFIFEKKNNHGLISDAYPIDERADTIVFHLTDLERADSLIPTFVGNYDSVLVGGAICESGVTVQNFEKLVKYELKDRDGNCDTYYVKVLVANLIPIIDIRTENAQPVNSKKEYLNASFRITNTLDGDPIIADGKIRGRGNASWGAYPKKPYKIKFSQKQSPFGFPANKDWVLLADYTDKSLLRTSYMSEVSRALDMKFTINYQHVELYLNDEYCGVYLLTDHVEKAKSRVNVSNDGFLIEKDNYYQYEPLYFVTDSFQIGMTFKYPDADDGDIIEGDVNFDYIKDYMNHVEKAMINIPKGSQDYLDLIEIHSFAKWIIAEEVLGNIDTNFYYVMPSRGSKIETYPLWDFEWSLGLAEGGEEGWMRQPYQPNAEKMFWIEYPYIKYLYYDPYFLTVLQEEWNKFKIHVPQIQSRINQVAKEISHAQEKNFTKWPTLSQLIAIGCIALGDWNKEVQYAANFFERRVKWCDDFYNYGIFEKYKQ